VAGGATTSPGGGTACTPWAMVGTSLLLLSTSTTMTMPAIRRAPMIDASMMMSLFDCCCGTDGRSTPPAGAAKLEAPKTGRSSAWLEPPCIPPPTPAPPLLRVIAAMARMSMRPEPSEPPPDLKAGVAMGEREPSLEARAARLLRENRTEFSLR
jgi:hypothetical protein